MLLFRPKPNNEIEALPEEERKREIIGFMGKTGSGKSWCMKNYIKELNPDRCVIIDTMSEYNQTDLTNHGLKNFQIITELEECLDYIFSGNDLIRIVYQPLNIHDEIGAISEAVYTLSKCAFCFEEIDLVLPQKGSPNKSVLKLIQRGRHRAISIYWTTQTPSEVSKILIKNTNKLFIFRITEKNDLAYLTFCDRDLKEQIARLDNHKYIEIL
jgi:DNA helicase HerA-like ATPase